MTSDRGRHFGVLIIGGGNAGVSAAARLLRKGVRNVGLVEPQGVHTYRPLLSYVGGGEARLRSAERTQRSITPDGCTWLEDSAVGVDPGRNTVECASGIQYGYDDLIVVPGLVPDHDELPGIHAALGTPAVASNYLDHAEKTWKLVDAAEPGGHAVFTVPRPPVSCTGTTIKPLLLAAAHWQRTGRSVRMTLVVDRTTLLPAPELDARLRKRLQELRVQVRYDARVTALDPGGQAIEIGDGTSTERLPYDLLHLVPPFRGPRWLDESGLTGSQEHGLVDVDPNTMRHRAHPNVWAAGDAAALETDPSGGALRRQIKILVDNLLAARAGEPMTSYDGYTVAPVTTDRHRLMAGEFDRSGALASSLPSFVDSTKPRRSAWVFDRYALPASYWHLILKGRL